MAKIINADLNEMAPGALEFTGAAMPMLTTWRGAVISYALWRRIVRDQGKNRYRIFKAGGRWQIAHAGQGIVDNKTFAQGASSIGEMVDTLRGWHVLQGNIGA